MTLRDRLQWLFRMALMLFILMSVAFLSALTAMRFAIHGREVVMPDVVGKKNLDAQQILRGRGVSMKVEDRIYSLLPLDQVVRQSPPPNMKVKLGQYAHVVLSLGPQKVTIPPVGGRSVRLARIELLRRRHASGRGFERLFARRNARRGDPAGSRARHFRRDQSRTKICSSRWGRGPRLTPCQTSPAFRSAMPKPG